MGKYFSRTVVLKFFGLLVQMKNEVQNPALNADCRAAEKGTPCLLRLLNSKPKLGVVWTGHLIKIGGVVFPLLVLKAPTLLGQCKTKPETQSPKPSPQGRLQGDGKRHLVF